MILTIRDNGVEPTLREDETEAKVHYNICRILNRMDHGKPADIRRRSSESKVKDDLAFIEVLETTVRSYSNGGTMAASDIHYILTCYKNELEVKGYHLMFRNKDTNKDK